MEMTDRDRSLIRSVIECQLQAFQRDDAVEAFAFASPGIQQQFQTPEKFIQMVKTAYAVVYRPRSVIFEALTLKQGTLIQPVLLLDPAGHPVRSLYLMQQQSDKSWRINGCYLVPIEAQPL